MGIAKSVVRNYRLYILDLTLSAFALVFAAALRVGPQAFAADGEFARSIVFVTVVFVAICSVTFPVAGLYKRNWRYASILDYIILVRAVLIASIILTTCVFLYSRLAFVPRSVILIEIMALVPLLASVRLTFKHEDLKSIGHFTRTAEPDLRSVVPVLLVGAGDEADHYLRALQRDNSSSYCPVGLIDGSEAEIGTILRGVQILGTPPDFDGVVADLDSKGKRPRHVIFTAPVSSIDGADHVVKRAEELGMAVSRLNPATALRKTRNSEEFELRPIELTDLLERPQASLDVAALHRFIGGRRVLVTGAGGSIGSELTKQIAALGPSHLVVIDNCEFNLYSIDLELSENFPDVPRSAHLCDVRSVDRLNDVFSKHHPEFVFHTAALKHVPMVELNSCEGVYTNVLGTKNVAEAVMCWGALGMVQVSTDKVVNSTSIMGATKRLAELYCQALDLEGVSREGSPRFMTVRFGNVLGSSGSLIPLFKRQLARGGPLTVTHPDMKRFFMTIREAVELTLQASAYGLEKEIGQGEIFVLDMGEPIKIVDIARRMIRLAGLTPDEDVKIDFVGCRPGEKLFEELFDSSEERVSPPVPGVLGAVPKPVSLPELYDTFAKLEAAVANGDAAAIIDAIRLVLPNFRAEGPAQKHKKALAHRSNRNKLAVLEKRPTRKIRPVFEPRGTGEDSIRHTR
ncbi:polysaccharide biosynthesis protein [Stappia sediminis]|uniref:polysaccharide biosynthesis protein n=1 Tax=Stappia sediminis TaxID=2692190 RepID=UPI00192873A7|nr:nucleoside-diphosphate sugar epimerase/dehydratase [Stappia sediminis]